MMTGTSACTFRGKVVFSKFSNFTVFEQQTHTPARACTRHPAKHGSKGLTWGLDTAEHRLHCYVDYNSGCCSGDGPARSKAPGHNNSLCNSILLLPCLMFYWIVSVLFLLFFWYPCMAINVSVQYNGGFLPDIILLTQCYYHWGTRLNAMKRFCICSL